MSLESEIEEMLASLALQPMTVPFPDPRLIQGEILGMEKRIEKLKGEGVSVAAVYSRTPATIWGFDDRAVLRLEASGNSTDIFMREERNEHHKFLMWIGDVALSEGKVAFEFFSYFPIPSEKEVDIWCVFHQGRSQPVILNNHASPEELKKEYEKSSAYRALKGLAVGKRAVYLVDRDGKNAREVTLPDPSLESIEEADGVRIRKKRQVPHNEAVVLSSPGWVDGSLELAYSIYSTRNYHAKVLINERSSLTYIGYSSISAPVFGPVRLRLDLDSENRVTGYTITEKFL